MEQMEEKKERPWLKKLLLCFFVFLLLVVSLLLYSRFIGTSGLKIKEYKITDSTLPETFHGFKIVHLSDIHYGRTVQKKELEHLVDEVNLLKPDIVVLTGDLIDRDTELNDQVIKEISSILSNINVVIAKYAITGNHDVNFKEWNTIIKNGGFKNLNEAYDLIYNEGFTPILIAGSSSNLESELSIKDKFKPIATYLASFTSNDNQTTEPPYKILLLHEPDYLEEIDYQSFHLILAGHSHNGQVRVPFYGAIVKVDGARNYFDEYYDLSPTQLYISSGVGTSRYNFRLFNRPSINFYRLTTH